MNFFIDLSDKRNNYIANSLLDMGHNVNEFDFEKNNGSEGDIFIFSPAKKFDLKELGKIQNLPTNTVVFGGNLAEGIKLELNKKKIKFINLLNDENFVIKNAKLTAEGVLALVIGCGEKSIFENKVLILGSGRVGLAAASLFNKIKINADFAIFHENKLSVASFYCENVVFKDDLPKKIGDYDIIINTVPAKILDDEILNKINKKASILEIASVNCLNTDLLKFYTFKYILAPALPMVYSAETAGKFMLDSILKQLNNLKENDFCK